MSIDREEDREPFLRRWSRVKTDARTATAQTAPPAEGGTPAVVKRAPAEDSEPPLLTPVAELDMSSDYTGYFHPKVDESLRRSALRKLFSDPHFNVMDGLDTYIDDYSISEPIPPAMLAGMRQAQRILEWAAETPEAAEKRRSMPPQSIESETEPPPAIAAEEAPSLSAPAEEESVPLPPDRG